MQEIAMAKNTVRTRLIAQIDQNKPANLSSAIRLFVLAYYQAHGYEAQAQRQATNPELCYSLEP
jgi:predicted DNA-binding ribbon-helix-helix protein